MPYIDTETVTVLDSPKKFESVLATLVTSDTANPYRRAGFVVAINPDVGFTRISDIEIHHTQILVLRDDASVPNPHRRIINTSSQEVPEYGIISAGHIRLDSDKGIFYISQDSSFLAEVALTYRRVNNELTTGRFRSIDLGDIKRIISFIDTDDNKVDW
jgi:hypothetical protein